MSPTTLVPMNTCRPTLFSHSIVTMPVAATPSSLKSRMQLAVKTVRAQQAVRRKDLMTVHKELVATVKRDVSLLEEVALACIPDQAQARLLTATDAVERIFQKLE